MDQMLRLILKVCFLFIFVYVISVAFIRLFTEETTISLEQLDGISKLPSFTICPSLYPGDNNTYAEFEANKNHSINGFMKDYVQLFDMIDASLYLLSEYTNKLVYF
jgi:hypothetical protein